MSDQQIFFHCTAHLDESDDGRRRHGDVFWLAPGHRADNNSSKAEGEDTTFYIV